MRLIPRNVKFKHHFLGLRIEQLIHTCFAIKFTDPLKNCLIICRVFQVKRLAQFDWLRVTAGRIFS